MTNINKFAVFAFNYPHGFIQQVWEGNIANHLQSKFNGYYASEGAKGVMMSFYMALDGGNRRMLEEFIIETV